MRTTLESGAWIEHVPLQDIKGKHIRAFRRLTSPRIAGEAIGDDGKLDVRAMVTGMNLAERTEATNDAVVALVVTAWSFDGPVPKADGDEVTGGEALDELPGDDLIELERLLAPFAEKLSARPDPKGVTTSSSNGSSRASAHSSRRG